MVDDQLSGRELTRIVAERIMGWSEIVEHERLSYLSGFPQMSEQAKAFHVRQPVPRYAESIEAAMQVVEKMREHHWCVSILNQFAKGPRWYASFETVEREAYAADDSLSTAICRAAL